MEVGAVKHALNNEIIHIKKKLNQTKIQLIHKLTRKVKTLKKPRKTPENLKEKLQRKADAAVAEVLLIKKVQAKDLVRFAIDHKGSLKDYLNMPKIDNEKVYAKILLHKTLTEKYNSIRERFANMPVDELLMTRKERLKLKKERNDAIKLKNKKGKNTSQEKKNKGITVDEEDLEQNGEIEDEESNDDTDEEEDAEMHSDCHSNNEDDIVDDKSSSNNEPTKENLESDESSEIKYSFENKYTKVEHTDKKPEQPAVRKETTKSKQKIKKPTKKQSVKERGKNVKSESVSEPAMVIDSFFLTTSGDNYMTLAEPRQPDEVKEVHQRGNRKIRRAEMFGKPVKFRKLYNHDKRDYGNNFAPIKDTNLRYEKAANIKNNSFSANRFDSKDDRIGNKLDDFNLDKRKAELPSEKLHPSWEAKKQKSGIVAFQGKKVVF